MQHNASALSLLGVQQGARGLISINVTFFMSLLGWQSMLALFLASFIGPGLVSPDLANNALSLYLARPFSRVEYAVSYTHLDVYKRQIIGRAHGAGPRSSPPMRRLPPHL